MKLPGFVFCSKDYRFCTLLGLRDWELIDFAFCNLTELKKEDVNLADMTRGPGTGRSASDKEPGVCPSPAERQPWVTPLSQPSQEEFSTVLWQAVGNSG